MDSLIGCTGFVGGNLARQHEFGRLFNSANVASAAGEKFDLVVCAAPSAVKWKANAEPEADLKIIEKLMDSIKPIKTKKFVQISTVDVYPNPVGADEETEIDKTSLQPYGQHRLMLEKFVRDNFPSHLIVRLPALFGPGLKKNFIYDMLHGNRLDLTDADSEYQFYCLDWLWKDLSIALESGIALLNVTSKPVSAREVAAVCFGREFSNKTGKPPVRYDMRSVHCSLFGGNGGYLYGRKEVLGAISSFVKSENEKRSG
jgi:hypothetical protein